MSKKPDGWDAWYPDAGVLDESDPRAVDVVRAVPKGAIPLKVGGATLGYEVRRKKQFSGFGKRINELVRLLPERDDWRPFLITIGDAVVGKSRQIAEREANKPEHEGSINLDEVARMSVGTILRHLPECSPEEALEVATELAENPYYLDAKGVAVWHKVTSEERQRLKFETIGVWNQSKAQWTKASADARSDRAKEKKRLDRLAAGATPQSQSLAAQLRAAGIPPSTYRYNLKKGIDLLADALRGAESAQNQSDASPDETSPRPLRRARTAQHPRADGAAADGGVAKLDTFGAPSSKKNSTRAETGQLLKEEPMTNATTDAAMGAAGPDAPLRPATRFEDATTQLHRNLINTVEDTCASVIAAVDASVPPEALKRAIIEAITPAVASAAGAGARWKAEEQAALAAAEQATRTAVLKNFEERVHPVMRALGAHPGMYGGHTLVSVLAMAGHTSDTIRVFLDRLGPTQVPISDADAMRASARLLDGMSPEEAAVRLERERMGETGKVGAAGRLTVIRGGRA